MHSLLKELHSLENAGKCGVVLNIYSTPTEISGVKFLGLNSPILDGRANFGLVQQNYIDVAGVNLKDVYVTLGYPYYSSTPALGGGEVTYAEAKQSVS